MELEYVKRELQLSDLAGIPPTIKVLDSIQYIKFAMYKKMIRYSIDPDGLHHFQLKRKPVHKRLRKITGIKSHSDINNLIVYLMSYLTDTEIEDHVIDYIGYTNDTGPR